MTDYPKITANDVLEIIQLFELHRIDLHIDGGWGVDALLGRQTRTHADLDIAVEHKDVAQIRAMLEARGYRDMACKDITLSWEITRDITSIFTHTHSIAPAIMFMELHIQLSH
jgi:hypothetical protein